MYTLNDLPGGAVIRIYATCDRYTPESVAEGDAEEHGWVGSLSDTAIYPSRNDVAPILEYRVMLNGTIRQESWHDTPEEAREEMLEEISELLRDLGSFETDDGSTLYASDSVTWDYRTADEYRYAVHAHVKHYTAERGWVEDDLDIVSGEQK